jgi:hypothetical protein
VYQRSGLYTKEARKAHVVCMRREHGKRSANTCGYGRRETCGVSRGDGTSNEDKHDRRTVTEDKHVVGMGDRLGHGVVAVVVKS